MFLRCATIVTAPFALIVYVALAQTSTWNVTEGWDPANHTSIVVISKKAEDTIRDEYDKADITPLFTFACASDREGIMARIDWRRFISSFNTQIGFKVDEGKTLWQKWGVDQSNTVTSSKSVADTAALIDYIGSGEVLAVDIAPYAGSPIVVHFDLAGFSASMDTLRAACGANGS